jgi:hypothetical protein
LIAVDASQEATAWWVAPGVIAATIAAVVAIVTLIAQARRNRVDRQRQVFADAFADVAAYCEYPYIIRRRLDDNADRLRITNDLSEVQQRINKHRAILRVESPTVAVAYETLVSTTRSIAGAANRDGWDQPVRGPGDKPNVSDVDLSAIAPAQDAYLQAVADHLSAWPAWARRPTRKMRR